MKARNSEDIPTRRVSRGKSLEEALPLLRQEGFLLRLRDWLCALDIAGIVLLLVIVVIGGGALTTVSTAGAVVVIVLGVVVALLSLLTRRYREATEALAKSSDRRVVGLLAEALEYEDGRSYEQVVHALRRLLPRLKPADADLLTAEQRGCLYRALLNGDPNADARFLLTILRALKQIGDTHALGVVETLATSCAETRNEKRLQAAARDCLIVLREKHVRNGGTPLPAA